jgi:aryl-alcohol dehydrogenase-like predicted oxidoreductase
MAGYLAKSSAFKALFDPASLAAAFLISAMAPSVASRWSSGMSLAEINGVALVAWGVFHAALLSASALSSFQNGKFMGKAFSSIWLPVKATIAIMVMMPQASAGGQSLAQMTAAWIAALF